jgi:hypothetical protein
VIEDLHRAPPKRACSLICGWPAKKEDPIALAVHLSAGRAVMADWRTVGQSHQKAPPILPEGRSARCSGPEKVARYPKTPLLGQYRQRAGLRGGGKVCLTTRCSTLPPRLFDFESSGVCPFCVPYEHRLGKEGKGKAECNGKLHPGMWILIP